MREGTTNLMDQLNLKRVNCVRIVWGCRLDNPDLELVAILSDTKEWERKIGVVPRTSTYEADGTTYHVLGVLRFDHAENEFTNLWFTLDVSTSPVWPQDASQDTPGVGQLVDVITRGEQIKDLYVDATFRYPLDEFQSVVQLPVPMSCGPDTPAEMVGLTLRVKEGDEGAGARYTNEIRWMDEGEIIHMVRYRSIPPIASDCLAATLELASSFSRRLISPRIQESSHE